MFKAIMLIVILVSLGWFLESLGVSAIAANEAKLALDSSV